VRHVEVNRAQEVGEAPLPLHTIRKQLLFAPLGARIPMNLLVVDHDDGRHSSSKHPPHRGGGV
jgi:hypothetical protein